MHSTSRAYLAPGMTFRRGPATYTVRAIDDWSHMTCEIQNGQLVTLELKQFEQEYLQGHIVGLASQGRPIALVDSSSSVLDARWEVASKAQRDEARRHYRLIKHLEREAPIVFDMHGVIEDRLARAAQALDEREPSRTTFWRWYHDYVESGGTIEACLRQRHVQGGSRKSRLDDMAKQFLDEALAAFATGRHKRTSEEWTKVVNAAVVRHNDRVLPSEQLRPIHVSTWKKHVRRLPLMVQLAERGGRRAAHATLKSVDVVAEPDFPLQLVQMDHSKLQLNCRDEATGKLYGEIWMTAMICRRTRVILGFVLHIARHDAEVVGRCFAMMGLPKTDFKAWCPEAVNNWPCYGFPNLLLGDNGKEFISASFRTLAQKFDVNLAFAPAYTPEWKASIERWFGTIKRSLFKRLLGATERPTAGKTVKPKDAEGDAFTLAQLDALIARWIVDVYHTELHATLGTSPIEAWRREIPNVFRSIPASVDDLLCRAGKPELRKLGRQGILLDGDQYKSPELDTLYMQLGPDAGKVKAMVSHRSAYAIYVVDPIHGVYVKAFNTNEHCRPDYTREQWDRIKQTASERNLNVATIVGVSTAASLVEQANARLIKSSKAHKRAVARKLRSDGEDLRIRSAEGGAPAQSANEPSRAMSPRPAQKSTTSYTPSPKRLPADEGDFVVVADLPFTSPYPEAV